jgi:signal transduction histidine kinase
MISRRSRPISPPQHAGRLLDDFEFMARLAGAIKWAVPDIYRGINRATDFTEVMNEMTKVDYAEERRPIDLSALLEEMTQKYQALWGDREVQVHAELEPDIKVDGWLRVYESVFANLLENAGQAVEGSEEKRITVKLERLGKKCRVEVRDSGPGIPQGKRDAVFEFGYTTRPATGKGLGLGYVKNYVTLCGGDIQVGSAPEGGAQFLVTLPLAREPELPPPPDQD